MLSLLNSQIGRLRIVGFIEGVSFLIILFITMPLKYFFNQPGANRIIGMIHGLLFILYVFYVIQSKIEYRWSFKKMMLALLASIIPFGTFWADVKLFRNESKS